jgi:hypothetical protein
MVLIGGRTGRGSRTRNHISHILQNPLLIALDQLIEQPQHGLDHPRMWRNLPRLSEGFNGLSNLDPDRSSSLSRRDDSPRDLSIFFSYRQPAQRQPLRIQRGIIIGRLGKDFIRLRNGLGKSLLRGFPFPLPQGDDSVQGACIVIVLWYIILKRGIRWWRGH